MRFAVQVKRGGTCRFLAALLTLSTLATALLAPAATVREHGGQEADLIVHHGKVVTVDRDFSVRQAMAIKNGLILRVGCFWPSDFAFAARLTTGLILAVHLKHCRGSSGSSSSIWAASRFLNCSDGQRPIRVSLASPLRAG
jgi:hypothetical protein